MKLIQDKLRVKFKTLIRCNCNCIYCGLYKNISNLDSSKAFDNVYKMIDYLDNSHVSTVKILGGEPLLEFPKLLKIIKKCRNHGFDFILTTNAIELNHDKISF